MHSSGLEPKWRLFHIWISQYTITNQADREGSIYVLRKQGYYMTTRLSRFSSAFCGDQKYGHAAC
uniref:Uncharacterized protein n=1 Tax=Anguilla anguilla TaxID=7936 RepID=A0A0E9X9W6_ANGAN